MAVSSVNTSQVLLDMSLDDKYALDTTRAYMTGIEALVRLPILQHQRDIKRGLNTAGFISGYRGSPLGGVDKALWSAKPFLDKHRIEFLPAINEDLAASAVWGSQQLGFNGDARYDGVFSMWYGKGPGVDRSMDVIKHANACGVSRYGGVLAIAGDDHGCKSSTLPHQSEHMFIGASVPVLNPANVQEVLDLGIYGWELSRFCGCWVALKAISDNMDSAISAQIDPARIHIVRPEQFQLPVDGVHSRYPDSPLAQELRLNKYKIYAAREFARVNRLNRVTLDSEKPRLGIITTGKAYLDVMQALEDLGIDERRAVDIGLRIFKLGMSWPLEPVTTHAFARGLQEILVVEEKRSIVEDQLTGQLYNWPVAERPRVVGEFDETGADLLPNIGELNPAIVARAIAGRIKGFYHCESIDTRLDFLNHKERALNARATVINRAPHYCSGCPHSRSTRLPEGSVAYAGIGCHYMAQWMPGDRHAQTFSQMGGEGVSWLGQAPFTQRKHIFQNLGDGTYFHSGILAIRQAVASHCNITYKILYNDAVAMTGGQPVDGPLSVAKMVQQLRAEGVRRIAVLAEQVEQYPADFPQFHGLTVDHRDQLIPVERELRELPGTTVIIFDQVCGAEKRRRRKRGLLAESSRQIFINAEVCEGCGDCGLQSNCLSIVPKETALGRKREINQGSCNKDFSCVKGFCPSFVSVHGQRKKMQGLPNCPSLASLSDPVLPALDQPWNIVVAGIGGTGVLTLASLVAMAAHLQGLGCSTLNQTGLAQKFGSVISHVRVASRQQAIRSVRIPAGDADLLLGCDLTVACSSESLSKLDKRRSAAVINEDVAPTAEFIERPDMLFSVDAMRASVADELAAAALSGLAAGALAEQLLGDSLYANVLLLGFCWQRGLIPVSEAALMQAIAINAVAVDANQQAFRWGRLAAADHDRLPQLPPLATEEKAIGNVAELLADRCHRLQDYQSKTYADNYRASLQPLLEAESSLLHQSVTDSLAGELSQLPLTIAAARGLYRFMACKDEYEVARQLSDGSFIAGLRRQFEPGCRLTFHLAVPGFRRIEKNGARPAKRDWPQCSVWLFRLLARLKLLRGSVLDIFAYAPERRAEKQLLQDYRQLLQMIVRGLCDENYLLAQQLSALPSSVRGFGPVKSVAIDSFYQRRELLLKRWRGELIDVAQVSDDSVASWPPVVEHDVSRNQQRAEQ